MAPHLHQLLLASDVVGAWEYPPHANWQQLIGQIQRAQHSLEEALGVPLRLDDQVQDASFVADLGVLVRQPVQGSVIHLSYNICFRFSWFSKLYTIHGAKVDEYNCSEAQSVLSSAGFTYVPVDALQEQYDGVNEPLAPGMTWWTRYFDYL